MSKLIIDSTIFDTFPETIIGIVKVSEFINSNAETYTLLRGSEAYAKDHYTAPILELGDISKWREVYRLMGVKKGTRVSIEALLKRVLKNKELPSINPLVDIYNSVSIKHLFPCGGEDLSTIQGDIHLTTALGHESFMTIGSDENTPPNPGEIVYKDDLGCLCRCWNWREADRTKLTEETSEALLVIEAISSDRRSELEAALEDLSKLCRILLNAKTECFIMDSSHRCIDL